jgi:glyoxylase-like metal-dependent hydrolase (beta-lactamase superfamily II)
MDYFCNMLQVKSFTFGPFSENTYIVYNDQKDCLIIDPGMYNATEQKQFSTFIEEQQLKPKYLINTHCHIDHIFGNPYCVKTYGLSLYANALEQAVMDMAPTSAVLYGLHLPEIVSIEHFIETSTTFELGDYQFNCLFTPGHSPGSITLLEKTEKIAIVGDVLFNGSIGRTDLPGGHHQTLLNSIQTELFTLDPETVIYSGHGPSTSIGHEITNNPFFN